MRYRDRQTGRFVARATWKRSKAHAGARYVREPQARPKRKPVTLPKPAKPAKPAKPPSLRPVPLEPAAPRTIEGWEREVARARERAAEYEDEEAYFDEPEEIEGGADY